MRLKLTVKTVPGKMRVAACQLCLAGLVLGYLEWLSETLVAAKIATQLHLAKVAGRPQDNITATAQHLVSWCVCVIG